VPLPVNVRCAAPTALLLLERNLPDTKNSVVENEQQRLVLQTCQLLKLLPRDATCMSAASY